LYGGKNGWWLRGGIEKMDMPRITSSYIRLSFPSANNYISAVRQSIRVFAVT
jgi:hypothetical protein